MPPFRRHYFRDAFSTIAPLRRRASRRRASFSIFIAADRPVDFHAAILFFAADLLRLWLMLFSSPYHDDAAAADGA
jgi:hypothetical protein